MNTDVSAGNGHGFRTPKKRVLSRYQLTAVMDEVAPAVMQHARLMQELQGKIKEQDTDIEKLKEAISMKTRYRLHRACGSSWWLSLWRAL